MFRIFAVGLYLAMNICLGLYLHFSVCNETHIRPRLGELVMYFPVAVLFGLPVVFAVMIAGLLAGFIHKEQLT